MATILFYTPFDQRSRDVESLIIAFHKQGHRVIFLSQQKGTMINQFLLSKGIDAYSHVIPGSAGWWYFFRHLIFFVRFCYRHKVNVVYSHLEAANFVCAIAQYFVSAKTILCRHHIDEGRLYGFDKSLSYKITYRLAKTIVVESEHARRYMAVNEGIPEKKIHHINLAYDFSLYPQPSADTVRKIREDHSCDVLLLSICRLTPFKRPDLSIRLLKVLRDNNINGKLLILGRGEMKDELNSLVSELGLTGKVIMPGQVTNVIDYIKAADFFVHPSLLDSSSIAVKEAGLMEKPVIVCEGIGDFDDYIIHNQNGLKVSQQNFVHEAASLIATLRHDEKKRNSLGEYLKFDILRLFSIEAILPRYKVLNDHA